MDDSTESSAGADLDAGLGKQLSNLSNASVLKPLVSML
jgi:hypothetical protein